jgi:hypothetical protein
MIKASEIYNAYLHNILLIDNDDNRVRSFVDWYESEDDSDSGLAEIGLSNGRIYRQDEIKSLEII